MAFVPYLDSSCPVSRVGGVTWLDFWSVGRMGWPLCHVLFSHFGGFFCVSSASFSVLNSL